MEETSRVRSGAPRVLVVEDDPCTERLLRVALTEVLGCHVVSVRDGQVALGVAKRDEWDLVVTDIGLPGMNGLELAKAIKDEGSTTPTLVVTGNPSVERAVDAINSGVDGFLVKPVEVSALTTKVEEILEARSPAKKQRSILAVGAHPDDVEIGCGGALLKHARNGDRVTILTLTGGAVGGDATVRWHEAEGAARFLGAELIFGGLCDTQVSPGPETISVIERAVAAVQPDVVYTHSPHDVHLDHRAAHAATLVATRNVANVYCYQSPSSSLDFRPTKFLDIGDYLADKIELLRCFNSQVGRMYLSDSAIRASAAYWGRFAGFSLVEPLESVRSAG